MTRLSIFINYEGDPESADLKLRDILAALKPISDVKISAQTVFVEDVAAISASMVVAG